MRSFPSRGSIWMSNIGKYLQEADKTLGSFKAKKF
jgi:hypothetical protein